MGIKKIKRAIISVSDKSNLKIILPVLKKFNIEIISSGGSYKKIKDMNYKCIEISNYTGFAEMLDGRVKTLHPKIFAGLLVMIFLDVLSLQALRLTQQFFQCAVQLTPQHCQGKP